MCDTIPITLSGVGFKPKKENPLLNTREWIMVQQLASVNGITLKEPDPSCRKCLGRGYTALETHSKCPIACTCVIFDASGIFYNPVSVVNLNKKIKYKNLK